MLVHLKALSYLTAYALYIFSISPYKAIDILGLKAREVLIFTALTEEVPA